MNTNNPFTVFQQIAQQLMQPKAAVQPTPAAPAQLLPWADNRQLPTRPAPSTATAPTSVPGDTQAQQATLERVGARHVWRYADYQAAAAQPAFGYMGFPPVERGRVQEVLFLNVSQAGDASVSPAGSCYAWVGTQKPIDGATVGATPNVFSVSAATPNAFPFSSAPSRRQIFVHEGERVFITFKSLANNASMVGSLAVIDYEYSTWLKNLAQV